MARETKPITGTPIIVTRDRVLRVPLDDWYRCLGFRALDYVGLGYQVRVIKEPDAATAEEIPILLQWPSIETFAKAGASESALRIHEVKADDPIAQWLDKVLGARDSAKAGIRLYEEGLSGTLAPMSPECFSLVSYYRLGEGLLVRTVRAPFDKSRAWPAEVQILRDAKFSLETIEQLQKSLATGSMAHPLGLADVATIKGVLDAAPLADALRKAQWNLQGYDLDLNCQKITAKFSTQVDQLPFGLRITIGPRGSLIQLSGVGLERLERFW